MNSITKIVNRVGNELGTFNFNINNPVHKWYKFTAGFSYKFVEEIIENQTDKNHNNLTVFEPFAGCGTTLVSCQTLGINSFGNESQRFLIDVIKAKLNWNFNYNKLNDLLAEIKKYVEIRKKRFNLEEFAHPLLRTLYSDANLKELYLLRNFIETIDSEKYRLFTKLALSQSLHKLSIFPISSPYISRNKERIIENNAFQVFSNLVSAMYSDTISLSKFTKTSKVYKQDSRRENIHLQNNLCDLCITSPPYLNNLDYGEVSKVHTYFYEYTNNWNDITNSVRKKLVTGATTHYKNADFDIDEFKKSDFYEENKRIVNNLISKSLEIKKSRLIKNGSKSFDLLIMFYFKDMFDVLKEIRRVVKITGKAYLILGDSAPYGVFVPTTNIIGEISKNIGFNKFRKYEIRKRGLKWKNHKYRHNQILSENILVLE